MCVRLIGFAANLYC